MVTSPVSGSISTAARWVPKGKVSPGGLKSWSAERASAAPSGAAGAVGEGGDLPPADGAGGRAGDEEPPALGSDLEADVLGRRFEEPGGQLFRLLPDGPGVFEDRRPADGGAPAPEGADAARALVGVPVEDPHGFRRDAELLGGDLRPRGLVSLAVGGGAAPHRYRAVRLDRDPARFPGAEAADFHIAGDADAERLPAFGPTPRLFGAERRVAARIEREVERPFIVAAVVGESGRGAVGEPVGRDEVAAADFRRVEPEPAGEHIQRPLDQVGRLRAARPPIGLVGRGVRERAVGAGAGRRDVVGADDHGPGERGSGGSGPAEIGPAVVEDFQIALPDAAVFVRRQREVREQVPPVGGGLEVLGPGRGPAHRAAEMEREPRDEDFFGVEVRLGAEAAADLGRDGADPFRGEPEDARHALADAVGGLGGGPDRDPVAVHLRRHRPGLHRARDQPLDAEVQRNPHRALVALRSPFRMELPGKPPVPGQIGIEALRPLGERGPGISGPGEVPVFHDDRGGGVGGLLRRLGDDRGHRIADGERPPVGERPARREVEFGEGAGIGGPRHREGPLQGGEDVAGGEDPDDSRRAGGVRHLDRGDLGVRIGTPRERQVERAGERDVAGVERLPGHQPGVFPPPDPLADGLGIDRQLGRIPETRASGSSGNSTAGRGRCGGRCGGTFVPSPRGESEGNRQ